MYIYIHTHTRIHYICIHIIYIGHETETVLPGNGEHAQGLFGTGARAEQNVGGNPHRVRR